MGRNIRIYEVAETDLLYVLTDDNRDAVYYDKNNMTVSGINGRIVLTNNGSVVLSEFPYDFLIPLESSLDDLIEIIQGYLNNIIPIPTPTTTTYFTTRVDEYNATTTYIGKALPSTLDSDNSWQITKINESGGITEVLYADGDDSFDNVWDDRLTITYS